MIVLRVEHRDTGKGPYNGGGHEILGYTFDLENYPPPNRDGISNEHCGKNCGFETRDQFLYWFKPEACAVLAERGYILAHYEVEDMLVACGKRQVVFPQPFAKRVRVEPLAENPAKISPQFSPTLPADQPGG